MELGSGCWVGRLVGAGPNHKGQPSMKVAPLRSGTPGPGTVSPVPAHLH
jgi:hypothetical protein